MMDLRGPRTEKDKGVNEILSVKTCVQCPHRAHPISPTQLRSSRSVVASRVHRFVSRTSLVYNCYSTTLLRLQIAGQQQLQTVRYTRRVGSLLE